MDQNTVKRKIATALAVCLLAASAAPAVLAEDTGIALMEATPSEPTRAALKLTRITPGNGTLEVELTGTAGQNVTVRVGQRGRSVYGLESRAVCRDRAVRQIAYGKGIRVAGKYRRHHSGADAQAVRSDYAQADGE